MIKICIVCKYTFECYDKSRKGKRGIIKRPVTTVTCSHNCSREYIKHYYLYTKNKNENLK